MPRPAAQRGGWGDRWPAGESGSQGKSVLWALGAGAVVVSAAALRELLEPVQLAGPPPRARSPHAAEISPSRSANEISMLRGTLQALPATRYQGDFATHQTRKPGLRQGEPLIFLLSFSLQG